MVQKGAAEVASDAHHRSTSLGRLGEAAARFVLVVKGYRLRDRNWRAPPGELDLVVERGDEIVFVEVKTRSSPLYGGAVGAVGARKRDAMVRTAAAYLSRNRLWHRPCRFDLVAIERVEGPPYWRLRHIVNAFSPDLGRRL